MFKCTDLPAFLKNKEYLLSYLNWQTEAARAISGPGTNKIGKGCLVVGGGRDVASGLSSKAIALVFPRPPLFHSDMSKQVQCTPPDSKQQVFNIISVDCHIKSFSPRLI